MQELPTQEQLDAAISAVIDGRQERIREQLDAAISTVISRAKELSAVGVLSLSVKTHGASVDVVLQQIATDESQQADSDDAKIEQIRARFTRPVQ